MIGCQAAIGITDVTELEFRALGPAADQRILVERLAEELIPRKPCSDDREGVQGGFCLVYPEHRGAQVVRSQADSDHYENTKAHAVQKTDVTGSRFLLLFLTTLHEVRGLPGDPRANMPLG